MLPSLYVYTNGNANLVNHCVYAQWCEVNIPVHVLASLHLDPQGHAGEYFHRAIVSRDTSGLRDLR